MKPFYLLVYQKRNLTFIIFFFFSQLLFAQDLPIKGTVVDIANNTLEFASVALLKPLDSVLISFAYTDEKGQFEITDAGAGDYVLQIYLTGFLPYYKNISYELKEIDLKSIVLNPNVEQLDEVTITAVVPILIKNDTIAYNSKSFRIHHDDNIEDLLKKLPGVEVNPDGSLVAQGREVTKIYVDGKEFFSGDPALVLKNISADAIDKIEVIDKKSDEAELTGVSDGQKAYVINLTLKKTKNKRGFGKLAGGIGLDDKYFSNANYNRFSSKMQWSAIGKYNNINMSGSNIQDFLQFTGGLADERDDEDQEASKKNKKGLSGFLTTAVVGANFGYEFKKKEVFNADYFYNYSENNGSSQSKRVSYSGTRIYTSDSENDNLSSTDNHNLNFNYENKSSAVSRLIVKGKLNADTRMSNINKSVSNYSEENELRALSDLNYLNNSMRKKGNISVNYYRKLNENKRNFGLGFNLTANEVENDREQNSIQTRIRDSFITETFTQKDQRLNNNKYNFNFRFTEPLGNNHFLKLQSVLILNNNTEKSSQTKIKNGIDQQPLNYTIESKEKRFNTSIFYRYSTNLINLNFGTELQNLHRNFGLENENKFIKNQFYLNPVLTFRYKPAKGKNYVFNYRRSILSPNNNQSSPVLDDLNPFFIKMGNPELLTQKVDNIVVQTTNHNYKSSLSFYTKFSYRHTVDAIIQKLVIDEDYIKTRSYINYGSQDFINADFTINKRVKNLGLRYNFRAKASYRTSNSIIEFELNDVDTKNYLLGFSLENNSKEIFDLKAGVNYSVDYTNFSVLQDLNREYIKQHYFMKFDYDLSNRLNFNSQFDYYLYSDNQFESNQIIPFWNASISYSFSKNNQSILKLLLIDILDENVNIDRRSSVNYFEETTSEMLGQYFILSFTYRLNRNTKKPSA